MKFVAPYFDDVICIGEEYVNSVIIENQNVFRGILEDINHQISDCEGDCVLSIDNVPCRFSKYCEIMSDFTPFEINRKPLLNAINNALTGVAVDEVHYAATSILLAEIENHIDTLSFEFDCNLECEGISVQSLIKSAGIKIGDDYSNPLERIIDYMELMREFVNDKLFVTVNFRSYFDDESTALFLETALSHKYRILMLESCERKLLPKEKRLIIDEDMCII